MALCAIGELSINDFRRLKEVLEQLKRIDLKNKVDEFEKKVSATRRLPLRAATKQSMSTCILINILLHFCMIDFDEKFLMELSRQVGNNWKMVVRRLGLTDTEIDEVAHDHHRLREQSYQAFRIWVDKNGGYADANPDEIKKALLDFQLKRIAEEFFDIVV